jgi:ribosomal protein S18 acetylase RimI-like enzyme
MTIEVPTIRWRFATALDATLLAELNHQLIADEGHRNPMSVEELEQRTRRWLEADYRAVLFHQHAAVAYALFREDDGGRIHLRHFFVLRQLRRRGLGREAFRLLRTEVVPRDKRIVLEVLTANTAARAFWAALGFQDYAVTLELQPLGG